MPKEYAIEINLIEVSRKSARNKPYAAKTSSIQSSWSGTFTDHLPTARAVLVELCQLETARTAAVIMERNAQEKSHA